MPVASQIAHAAGGFRFNADLLDKSLEGISSDECCTCPGDGSNSLLWVAGHIVWARSRALSMLGTTWSRPWLPQFGRGAKLGETAEYPSLDELLLAWEDVKAALNDALENASTETLSAPGPAGIPNFDGMLSGVISFLALHESYHVGQAAYLRRWLGYGQVAG